MKKYIYILLLLLSVIIPMSGKAQVRVADPLDTWEFSADGYFYFLPENSFFLPVIRADKDNLHFEGRYNYEDLETFSGWAGYNFSGGTDVEYKITPMIGGIVGNTNGIAPGLEATINIKKFELYTEAEYVFDFESKVGNYFYSWTDLTYSVKDWLWFGLSGQRLRSYQSDLDLQHGIIVGGGGEKWQVNGYLFNIDTDTPFYVAGVSYSF